MCSKFPRLEILVARFLVTPRPYAPIARAAVALIVLVLTACAGPTPGQTGAPAAQSGRTGESSQAAPSRTMTMIVRYEVTDLAAKIPGSSSPVVTKRIFNASLALIDGQGNARPEIA
jgi:hypothetical protein